MNWQKIATEAIDDHRKTCLACSCTKRMIAAHCTNAKCPSYKWRNLPKQENAFGPEYKLDFQKKCMEVVDEMPSGASFTGYGMRLLFVKKYNGSAGPVHPNWWGSITKCGWFKSRCTFLKTIKSDNPKSKGCYTGLWMKRVVTF
jgi:hypothetical protein